MPFQFYRIQIVACHILMCSVLLLFQSIFRHLEIAIENYHNATNMQYEYKH